VTNERTTIDARPGRARARAGARRPPMKIALLRLVRLAEFKRKQAAPGLKVTDRAFGTG
jgi:NAD+ synthase (glutamine-hydrolysing)